MLRKKFLENSIKKVLCQKNLSKNIVKKNSEIVIHNKEPQGHQSNEFYVWCQLFMTQKWFLEARLVWQADSELKNFLREPILFSYYEESLVSLNLNSKLLWFLSVRPIEHPKIIQKVSLSASILKKDYKNNCV